MVCSGGRRLPAWPSLQRAQVKSTSTARATRAGLRTPVAIGFIASEPTAKFASALGSLAPQELQPHKMEPTPDVDAAVVQATKALDAVDDARAQAWAAVQAAATATGCAPGDLFGHKVNVDALQKPADDRPAGARQGGDGLEAAFGRWLHLEEKGPHQKTKRRIIEPRINCRRRPGAFRLRPPHSGFGILRAVGLRKTIEGRRVFWE